MPDAALRTVLDAATRGPSGSNRQPWRFILIRDQEAKDLMALDEIKSAGVWIVGLDGDADQNYTDIDMTGPVALVIGSEGDGMSRMIREKCDFLASLPLKGQIESLNASVTAGIMLYEALRQRNS